MKQQPIHVGMTCERAQRAIALAAICSSDVGFADKNTEPSWLSSLPSMETELEEENEGAWKPSRQSSVPSGSNDVQSRTAKPDISPKSEESALAEHLAVCRSCQAEMAATTAFFRALGQDAGPEPSPTLLARARMQLDATLDSSEQAGFWTRLTQQLAFTGGRLRAAPLLSSALLIVGLVAGGYGGYRAGHSVHAAEQATLLLAPPAPEAPSVVADVSSITRDDATGMVEIRYDRLVPDMLAASLSDPSIRELLMAATENGTTPQVRNTSVNLLGGGCYGSAVCGGDPVRNALLHALNTDATPEVRREAMAGLQPFIADDTQVRDAVLGALMNDSSGSVRIEAVRLLQPVGIDSSVRQVLHAVALRDGDPTIRSASLAALKSVPQIQ